MKCPKCGYNSFEFHDSCKKCANDLTGFKETYGLKPIVLPLEARKSMAEALMAAESALSVQSPDTRSDQVDMFSFDLPEEEATRATADDPFNFDDDPMSPGQSGGTFSFDEGQQSVQAKAEEDAFADLLESTSQQEAPIAAPAAGSAVDSDLTSFSWDDTSDSPTESNSTTPADDDFNSLFGDMDEPVKK